MAKVLEMPEQDINKLTDIDKKILDAVEYETCGSNDYEKDIEKFKEKGIEGKELDKNRRIKTKSSYRSRIGRINSTRFKGVSY